MAVAFTVNGKAASVDATPDTPLLWVVREHLKLTGTKFGCGTGLCGACTVHVDGQAVRSCQITSRRSRARRSPPSKAFRPTNHPLQKAWIAEQVPQCGYCQSGQIMQAAELLAKNKKPSREQIVDAHGRQHLPLRHLSAHRPRHPTRSHGRADHEQAQQQISRLSRRRFAGSAGLSFAFALGADAGAASEAVARRRAAQRLCHHRHRRHHHHHVPAPKWGRASTPRCR